VEELLLVDQNITPLMLYGYDLNRDGVIDTNEQQVAGGAAVTNGTTTDSRGMYNYLPSTALTHRLAPRYYDGNACCRNIVPKTIGLVNVNTASLQC